MEVTKIVLFKKNESTLIGTNFLVQNNGRPSSAVFQLDSYNIILILWINYIT